MTRLWRIVLISCLALSASVFATATDVSSEVTANVPALGEFHEVIVPIWHQAWPTKDTAMMRKMVPDVEKGVAKVAAAELPGILRDKAKAWQENVAKFQQTATEYKAAADAKDDARLLKAAEKLHSQFEVLVRIVKPVLKELDQFHTALYMLYHYEAPEYKLDKIKASVAKLNEKMAVLNQAKLPQRLSKKQSEFEAARTNLSKSLETLTATLATNDEKRIKDAVETMHTDYQNVEKVFD
ncbi:MAG TPA: hypothetical protein VD837_17320 [Terriglobales bacterium]|nr:hypothetical protein [Terriglobales bacterium]